MQLTSRRHDGATHRRAHRRAHRRPRPSEATPNHTLATRSAVSHSQLRSVHHDRELAWPGDWNHAARTPVVCPQPYPFPSAAATLALVRRPSKMREWDSESSRTLLPLRPSRCVCRGQRVVYKSQDLMCTPFLVPPLDSRSGTLRRHYASPPRPVNPSTAQPW